MSVLPFNHVIAVDFEFSQPDGELPRPICLVAKDLVSSAVWRRFGDELTHYAAPPYPIGEDTVVAYYASAEMGCHLALGWALPANVLDLLTEFRRVSNGLPSRSGGAGLLGALVWHGLDAMDTIEKDAMRALAIRGGSYTAAERDALLRLLRGRYMKAAAHIEATGVPIDTAALDALRRRWAAIEEALIRAIDADYQVFEGRWFKTARFAESTAELTNRIEAANRVCVEGYRKSPALVMLKRKTASA